MRRVWLSFTPLLCLWSASCSEDNAAVEDTSTETSDRESRDAAPSPDGGPADTPTEPPEQNSDASGSSAADASAPVDDSTQGNSTDGESSDVTSPIVDDAAVGTSHPEDTDGGDTNSEVDPDPLTPTTFVFERKVGDGNDHVVAMDYVSGEERIITTLAEGTVAGWNVDGISVSPDRTRLVLASRYGATAADVATGLATNILWDIDVNGGDFRRLTPVFESTQPGNTSWRIDVRDPEFSPDGQFIVFDYGEGDFEGGYVAPWVVAADGNSLPFLLETDFDCSVNNNATFNPVTGDLLLAHVVCLPEEDGGYYLYPEAGGAPDYLINEDGWSLSSEPPSFSSDGSVFLFTATTYEDNIQSLYAYVLGNREVLPIVSGTEDIDIVNASFAPDNEHIVYCVRQGDLYDLRVLDLGADPPTDVALTDDGVSCDPVF